jgi:hypothetical protein
MPGVRHCSSGVRFRSTSANHRLDEGVILKLPRKHCKELAIDSPDAIFPAGILAEVCRALGCPVALRTGVRHVCDGCRGGRRKSRSCRFQTLRSFMDEL